MLGFLWNSPKFGRFLQVQMGTSAKIVTLPFHILLHYTTIPSVRGCGLLGRWRRKSDFSLNLFALSLSLSQRKSSLPSTKARVKLVKKSRPDVPHTHTQLLCPIFTLRKPSLGGELFGPPRRPPPRPDHLRRLSRSPSGRSRGEDGSIAPRRAVCFPILRA